MRRCSVEELVKIALEMRITAAAVTDKTKVEVMRLIAQTIDGHPDEDQKMEIL